MGRATLTKYALDPDQVVVDALGNWWRPKTDRNGKVIIRPTRAGDRFLAKASHVRIVACHGRHFSGLTRLIMEPIPVDEVTF